MTRESAKAFLITLGIEEPSKEQIDNYLNQLNGETKKYSEKIDQGKKDAELVDELKAKLEELENQNLTDAEKVLKEKEMATAEIEKLTKQIKAMELKASLAEQGIVGDDATQLIESLGSGNLDVAILGKIITQKMEDAATAKEKEIADGTTNPNGGKQGGDDGDKPADVVNAESMASYFGTNMKSDNKDAYVLS